jgi:hypothetical protein
MPIRIKNKTHETFRGIATTNSNISIMQQYHKQLDPYTQKR